MSKESEVLIELLKTVKDNPELYEKASVLVDEYLDVQMKRNDIIDGMIKIQELYIRTKPFNKNQCG